MVRMRQWDGDAYGDGGRTSIVQNNVNLCIFKSIEILKYFLHIVDDDILLLLQNGLFPL